MAVLAAETVATLAEEKMERALPAVAVAAELGEEEQEGVVVG